MKGLESYGTELPELGAVTPNHYCQTPSLKFSSKPKPSCCFQVGEDAGLHALAKSVEQEQSSGFKVCGPS